MCKLILPLLCAIGLALGATAQDLTPVQVKKKFGYADPYGNIAIKADYNQALPFVNGRAMVQKGDKWGIIDTSGNPVLKIEYNQIVARVDGLLLQKGDKFGMLNNRLETVFPCEFNAIGSFNAEGFIWVNKGGSVKADNKVEGGKFGIYNRDGKVIVPVNYKTIGVMKPLSGGSYSSRTLKSIGSTSKNDSIICVENGLHYHLITRYTFTPEMLGKLDDGAHGFFGSTRDDRSKNAVFDLQGNMLIKENTFENAYYPESGLALVQQKGDKWNYYNVATQQLLFDKDDSLADGWGFDCGLAIVQKGSLWYFIDTTGRMRSPGYQRIWSKKGGVHIVKKANYTYNLVNASGVELLATDKTIILPPSEGLLYCREKTEGYPAGYVDSLGVYVIPPVYKMGWSFSHGLAAVKDENGWGLIRPDGTMRTPCRWYDTIKLSVDNPRYLWVKESSEEKWKCFDMDENKPAFYRRYDSIRNFDQDYPGVASVGFAKVYRIIDTTGKELIPFDAGLKLKFDSHAKALAAYKWMLDNGHTSWQPIDTHRYNLINGPAKIKANQQEITKKIADDLWDY